MDEEKTLVVFRKWRIGCSPIALFPGIDAGRGHCMSYERIGQHGAADYAGVIGDTRPASLEDADVKRLHTELETIGYNLDVRARRPAGLAAL